MGAGPNDAKKAEAEGDETAAGGSSKLFRCVCVRRWLSLAYREELYHVLRLTGPLVSERWMRCSAAPQPQHILFTYLFVAVLFTCFRLEDVRRHSWCRPDTISQLPTELIFGVAWILLFPVRIIRLNPTHRNPASLACGLWNNLCLFLQLLSRILNYLLPFVTTIFVGHIGNVELAGYALASAVMCLPLNWFRVSFLLLDNFQCVWSWTCKVFLVRTACGAKPPDVDGPELGNFERLSLKQHAHVESPRRDIPKQNRSSTTGAKYETC